MVREERDREEKEEGDLNRDVIVEEVQNALNKIKNKKAAGEEGIAAEIIKNLPREWLEKSGR